jgi:nucleotide-binding universal stress UspA family protein
MRLPAMSILCPTDLSATGNGAVALAYELAGPGATVHLLHVDEPALVLSSLDSTVLFLDVDPEGRDGSAAQIASAELRRLVPESAAARGVRTEVHVVRELGPTAVIRREARRCGAELIVLGTRGRGGIARTFLGSVAAAVLRQSEIPVVLFHDVPAR